MPPKPHHEDILVADFQLPQLRGIYLKFKIHPVHGLLLQQPRLTQPAYSPSFFPFSQGTVDIAVGWNLSKYKANPTASASASRLRSFQRLPAATSESPYNAWPARPPGPGPPPPVCSALLSHSAHPSGLLADSELVKHTPTSPLPRSSAGEHGSLPQPCSLHSDLTASLRSALSTPPHSRFYLHSPLRCPVLSFSQGSYPFLSSYII